MSADAPVSALRHIRSWIHLEALGAGALVACAALFASGVKAAKLTSTERTQIEEPRPADVPSDEFLEAHGAIVGKIELDVRQIFDERDPRENSGLYHLADQFHARTKPSTIRAQLLFRSGDLFKARVLAETERNLRALGYIYDARVVPVKYVDGKVTIRVITKDVWTLSPGVSFSRAGGTNSSGVDLADSNFLGLGKSLEIAHSSNVDRTSACAAILFARCPLDYNGQGDPA